EYPGRLYREVRKFFRRPSHGSDEGGDPVRADYASQCFGPPALQHLLHIGAREDRQRTIRKRHRIFRIRFRAIVILFDVDSLEILPSGFTNPPFESAWTGSRSSTPLRYSQNGREPNP